MTSYLIKSILCSGILLLVYHLFLEREKMHRFNRFYLLLSIVFSLTIPLLSIKITAEVPAQTESFVPLAEFSQKLLTIQSAPYTESAVEDNVLPDTWPLLSYVLVSLVLLARFLINFRSVLVKKADHEVIDFKGAKLVLLPQNTVTFSFLDNIFVSKSAFQRNEIEPEVLAHELAHVDQKHTLDILCIEFIRSAFWINPLLFFYKKAIQLNHEFLADEAVLATHTNKENYKLLLLDKILHARQMNLTSSFNYSVTKKRLTMMNKKTSMTRGTCKQVIALFLTSGLALLFSEKIYSQHDETAVRTNAQNQVSVQKTGSGLSIEEMNEFKNTIEAHTTFVKSKKGRTDPIVRMPPSLEDRMYELYTRMSNEQQRQQTEGGYMLFKMGIPVKKHPTPEMFEKWKIPTIFGVWINNKHVPNSELNKYKYDDIAEYDLSKLYGGALKGRIYKYQLNLLTNDYFDKTLERRTKDRVIITRVGFLNPEKK